MPNCLPACQSALQALAATNAILVNRLQMGNPLLQHLRNVRWQYAQSLVPDYQLGLNACALFLSLR
jgi:DNA excision repair protein ERCC-1